MKLNLQFYLKVSATIPITIFVWDKRGSTLSLAQCTEENQATIKQCNFKTKMRINCTIRYGETTYTFLQTI